MFVFTQEGRSRRRHVDTSTREPYPAMPGARDRATCLPPDTATCETTTTYIQFTAYITLRSGRNTVETLDKLVR